MTYPKTFSHFGLSVTDLDQAVEFYSNVFGWYVIMKPSKIVADNSAIGVMCTDVFGEGWGAFVLLTCQQAIGLVSKFSSLRML
jgi:predicted enzyme related to lactoylglutathione lyase